MTVKVRIDGQEIVALAGDREIARGQDASAIITAAIQAAPDKGDVLISAGLYELSADTLFYLDPGEKNPFWTCIPILEGKNVHIRGEGPGKTILRLKPKQHGPGHPVAMILARATSPFDPGYSEFSISDMTLEGNRSKQTAWLKDGAALILVGSERECGRYERLEFRNSYGSGLYLGNNGGGSGDLEIVSECVAVNCAAEGIILDTCQHSRVDDCYFEKCGTGLCLHGNSDNQTRPFDVLNVAHIRTKDAPITIWDVNDVTLHDVQMDASGCSKAYGLLVRSSTQVKISNSFFKSSRRKANSYGGASYISTGDGPCDVTFKNCFLDGYYALHLVGEAHAWMEGGALNSAYADVYLRDIEGVPVTARADIEGVAMLGSKLHADVAQGSSCRMRFCYFEKTPKISGQAEIICPVK